MITGKLDPVFDNTRFTRSFAFTVEGILIPWAADHVVSVTFRDPEEDTAMLSATSADGSGRVTLPSDGVAVIDFPNLTALGWGSWELVVMLANADGKMDGILLKLPIKTGGL